LIRCSFIGRVVINRRRESMKIKVNYQTGGGANWLFARGSRIL
jgi:hypothetical protein